RPRGVEWLRAIAASFPARESSSCPLREGKPADSTADGGLAAELNDVAFAEDRSKVGERILGSDERLAILAERAGLNEAGKNRFGWKCLLVPETTLFHGQPLAVETNPSGDLGCRLHEERENVVRNDANALCELRDADGRCDCLEIVPWKTR